MGIVEQTEDELIAELTGTWRVWTHDPSACALGPFFIRRVTAFEGARAEADRIACKVFAEQGELRAQLAIEHNALVELLAVVTSDEWKGALIMAGVHGFHGTPEGQARSQKAIQCATDLAHGPRGSK